MFKPRTHILKDLGDFGESIRAAWYRYVNHMHNTRNYNIVSCAQKEHRRVGGWLSVYMDLHNYIQGMG